MKIVFLISLAFAVVNYVVKLPPVFITFIQLTLNISIMSNLAPISC